MIRRGVAINILARSYSSASAYAIVPICFGRPDAWLWIGGTGGSLDDFFVATLRAIRTAVPAEIGNLKTALLTTCGHCFTQSTRRPDIIQPFLDRSLGVGCTI